MINQWCVEVSVGPILFSQTSLLIYRNPLYQSGLTQTRELVSNIPFLSDCTRTYLSAVLSTSMTTVPTVRPSHMSL